MTPGERSARRQRRWRLVLARRDAVPASLRRFMATARHRLGRRALLGLVATGLAIVLVVAGLVVLYRTPVLAVRQIRVTGTTVLAAGTVRAAARVPDGTPLAAVDLSAVRRRVESLPPVRVARVTRDWPHTLAVAVTERTAVAAVPHGSAYRLIDRTGLPFRTVDDRPAALPVAVLSHPGPHDATTTAVLTVLAALTPALRSRLVRVAAPRPTRIRLILHNGPTIVWGDSSYSHRKAAAATALLGKHANTIDVSAPDLVVVR